MSDPRDERSPETEQESKLPAAEAAWSVPVPEADQNPPDLCDDSVDDDVDQKDVNYDDLSMPRPVEAWTDEWVEEDAVAADQVLTTNGDGEDTLETDFPASVEAWSIAGNPNESKED